MKKILLTLLLTTVFLTSFAQISGHLYLGFTPSTGDIIWYDGTKWTKTTAGATGQLLRLNTPGGILQPQWFTPAYGTGTVTSFGKTDGYGVTSIVVNSTTTPVHTIAVDTTSASALVSKGRLNTALALKAKISGGNNFNGNQNVLGAITSADGATYSSQLGGQTISSGTGGQQGYLTITNRNTNLSTTIYDTQIQPDFTLQANIKLTLPKETSTIARKEDIKYGSTLVTFDGVQTVFNVPHGMGSTPNSFSLTFGDASNLNFVQSVRTLTSTNIVLTCTTPPLAGSQTVYWQAFR